ncbi:MAG TPA: hypothetical protein VH880_01530 [Anaeromyxobacteraceae bacterium]|jgi:hypothetical protein
MSAMARRSGWLSRLRLARGHELLAAVLVLGIVFTVVGHVLRASGGGPASLAPATVIGL